MPLISLTENRQRKKPQTAQTFSRSLHLPNQVLVQARREPQRGSGDHYRGALSQPHSVRAEIEMPKASRREETWGEVSPTI